MLRVALATENNRMDGSFFLALLRLLGVDAEPWSTSAQPFTGWQGIFKNLPEYLALAKDDGVRHALVAADNDGGGVRHPPHVETHDQAAHAQDHKAGCRACRFRERIPQDWRNEPFSACVVVPVQTIETWLLVLRDHEFANVVPEKNYDRGSLKKQFWATDLQAPDARRVEIIASALAREDALDVLRQRPSFVQFEAQVGGWS